MAFKNTVGFLVIFLSLFIFSCSDNSESPSYPDLKTYLTRFEEEAKLRGYDLDLSGVEAVYVEGQQECYKGTIDGNGLRRIEISKAGNCDWLNLEDIEREKVIFHSIGRSFLDRPIEDIQLCDGSAVSLLVRPQTTQTYNEGEIEKRDYYISELLDRLVANEQCIKKPQDWEFNPVFYKVSLNDQGWHFIPTHTFFEGNRNVNHHLQIISLPGSSNEDHGYWYKQFEVPNIPECADITYKVTYNASQMQGPGASIAIRAYHAPVARIGATTEEYLFLNTDDTPFTGETEDFTHELFMPCFSRKTTYLLFFVVMLPGTTGELSVKDVEILVNEN